MDDAIVPLDSLALTALVHRGTKWRRTFWEATCPELDISVRAEGEVEARAELQTAVQQFLQTASAKEIEESLDNGTTYSLAPLPLAHIVRDDEAELSWLQRVPSGAVAAAGAAKDKAGDLASAIGGAAATSGHFVADTAVNAYGAVGEIAGSVGAKTRETVDERAMPLLVGLTERAGNITESITNHSPLRRVAKAFNLEQWLDISSHVDLEKAARVVANLKNEFPAESNRQIARRLITQKALYAGGVGLSTSLPGLAIPMLALDVAATSLLQAELVLQIAAVYGLDLDDPARKGEMLAVFGCVLGGNKAGKAGLELFRNSELAAKGLNAVTKVPVEKIGLGVLRNVPLMGAAIGATANAAIIYALGNAACSFYEKRLNVGATDEAMKFVKRDTELYLESSATQKQIADQVLLHVVLAGRPATDKAKLLAALREMDFSDASIETIESGLESPKSLEELLPQLDGEFVEYVAVQARNIAQMDGSINDEESKILQLINRYFANLAITKIDIDLDNS